MSESEQSKLTNTPFFKVCPIAEKAITCPISNKIMTDPVNGDDGYTYERASIVDFLTTSYKKWGQYVSPMTQAPMRLDNLTSNKMVKMMIDNYNQNQRMIKCEQPQPQQQLKKKKQLKIESTLCTGVFSIDNSTPKETKLHIRIRPDIPATAQKTAVVFVIDTSGSMSEKVSKENIFLTKLDLVKHAIKTVINVMDTIHNVCLISFDTSARLVQPFVSMTAANKAVLTSKIDSLFSDGCTDIWGGLMSAMNEVKKLEIEDMNINIALLTDGMATMTPSKGIVGALLDELKKDVKMPTFTISTFGFGYDVDSKLLDLIARHGSGTYGFIPDCSMVGTVFVNWVSNVLATYVTNSHLIVMNEIGKTLIEKYTIGPIVFDQTRDLIFNVNNKDFENLKIVVTVNKDDVYEELVNRSASTVANTADLTSMICHFYRNEIIKTINAAIDDSNQIKHVGELFRKINIFISSLSTSRTPPRPCDMDMIQKLYYDYEPSQEIRDMNMGGQIKEAFSSPTYLEKWGRHYLRSLMNAYNFQQCNNFKDPGVQVFAGNFFIQFRQTADKIFCEMPIPTGTGLLIQASTYHNSSAGCFSGYSLVKTPNGLVMAENIRKGHILSTSDGRTSTVRCVVKTKVNPLHQEMCLIFNTFLTPYHPVILNGEDEWKFPINVVKNMTNLDNMEYVYNFVLEENHIIEFDCGTRACTLGHNFTENHVVSHPYFGSQRVIEDLMQCDGWTSGLVIFNNLQLRRENGYICQMFDSQ